MVFQQSGKGEMMDEDILSSCMQRSERGVYLDIDVSPDSSVDRIKGVNRWRDNVEVALKERAEGGKANRSLVTFFSDMLGSSESDIKIVRGKRSNQKRIFISSIDERDLLSLILEEIGEERCD